MACSSGDFFLCLQFLVQYVGFLINRKKGPRKEDGKLPLFVRVGGCCSIQRRWEAIALLEVSAAVAQTSVIGKLSLFMRAVRVAQTSFVGKLLLFLRVVRLLLKPASLGSYRSS